MRKSESGGSERVVSVKGGVRELECNIGEGESESEEYESGDGVREYERVGSVSGGVRKGGT